jgi:hypothetical protein
VNVISKTAKLVLNLPEIIINALIVTLSVALQPVKILKKSVNVICDDYALGFQEKIWIAPKGKPLELMIRRCHLFRVPTETLR